MLSKFSNFRKLHPTAKSGDWIRPPVHWASPARPRRDEALTRGSRPGKQLVRTLPSVFKQEAQVFTAGWRGFFFFFVPHSRSDGDAHGRKQDAKITKQELPRWSRERDAWMTRHVLRSIQCHFKRSEAVRLLSLTWREITDGVFPAIHCLVWVEWHDWRWLGAKEILRARRTIWPLIKMY